MNTGINVQAGSVTTADVADLRRFAAGGALLICDWPELVAETLALLDAAGVPVALWRWTQDPAQWPGWPGDYLKRCDVTLFANEPDLEGFPIWYGAACQSWADAGGLLVEPAWHEDAKRTVLSLGYHAVSAHCYAGDVANLVAVRARAAGRPVLLTEYAHQGQQHAVLQELADAGVTEPTSLFVYRWKPPGNQPGFDLAGVPLDAPISRQDGAQAVRKDPTPMTVPELDQGWTKACWAFSVAECFDGAGHYVSPFDIYAQVKGQVFAAPGLPATFDELRAAVNAAAAVTNARVKWFGPLGICNDPGVFDQLVGDGWLVIAGVKESDLQPGQTYGHYVVARRVEWLDGKPYVDIVDSYRAEDGGTDRYALTQFHAAMAQNWDPNVDALAFQIVGA